ncbi:MAG: EpsI family protein [Candidatus Hydrogenedentes bacterium]|nr:EpsI family protein [Candidatus Hydrogenedentota bacterium]
MKRYLITFIMLLATAILHLTIRGAEANTAANSSPSDLFNLPSEILEFHQAGPDIPVSESIRQQLESNAILMRSYSSRSGGTILMTIVCAGTTRRSLHFPEVCFTGQGWETQDKAPIPVGVYFVGQGLTLQRGKSRQAVLYWFKTGNDFTGSYFVNSLCWVRDKLLLRNPSSMLIRLSIPVDSSGEQKAFRMLNDFASSLAPILQDRIP